MIRYLDKNRGFVPDAGTASKSMAAGLPGDLYHVPCTTCFFKLSKLVCIIKSCICTSTYPSSNTVVVVLYTIYYFLKVCGTVVQGRLSPRTYWAESCTGYVVLYRNTKSPLPC